MKMYIYREMNKNKVKDDMKQKKKFDITLFYDAHFILFNFQQITLY